VSRSIVDFETEKIQNRPVYPPRPVGVAIRERGKSEYLAWGHPDGNNCDVETARRRLRDVYRSRRVVFHNSAFDVDVSEVHLGVRPPSDRVEDTLYLSFLKDPYEETIALKPLAEKHLGERPEQRDRLKDWILDNVPAAKRKPSSWGEYICLAPVSIVGPYACGDVDRTDGIYAKFKPEVYERGMGSAYERELALTDTTLEMERSGVRIDMMRIKEAILVFDEMEVDIRKEVEKRLRIKPDFNKPKNGKPVPFNMGSAPQLARALMAADKLDEVVKTPSGGISTRISVLQETCNDKKLLELLAVHSVIKKYTGSFLNPWLAQGELTDGRILPSFNQVRARTQDGGGGGARSGRYSSSDPNLQNISANVEESKNRQTLELMAEWLRRDYGYEFIGLRDFILPDEGTTLIAVDYNQQELRLLAHFEDGSLADAYRKNPKLDVHTYIQQLVKKLTGIEYERKFIKIAVFGIIYGMGLDKLALMLGEPKEVAKAVRDGVFKAVPGIKDLMRMLEKLARKGSPLITWGGRQYYCEEPRFVDRFNKWMSFEYKMLNYLIQPSAADVTKQGMLNVREELPNVRIAIQVHDELVCMAPNRSYGPRISQAMCDMKFNIPMLAEAKYSTSSWARAE
jgi:DNA polymerase I-like protein with 3'-5' exonuclease and polymerase domains